LVLVGLAAGVGLVALGESQRSLISRPMRLALWKAPVYLAFGAMLAPVPLLSCRMLRGQPRSERQRFPWEALALLLLTFASLALRFVQPGSRSPLPAAGAVQDWRSSDHVVPGAWLPTITWAGWLLRAVRWLLIPYALLGAVNLLRDVRPRLTAPAHPESLMWAGLGWIVAFAWDAGRLGFPLRVVRGGPSAISGYPAILGGIVLLLVARAAERKRGVWARWLCRWIALAALALMLIWVGRAGWDYGRALVAPLPAWADRWQYGALPRIPLTALSLTAHLVVGGLGLLALISALRAWRARARLTAHPLPAVAPLLALVGVAGLWWWITTPRIVRTVPPDGATGVPRDTGIRIEMKEREWLGRVLGRSGQGIHARYTDTGERILGRTGGSATGVHFAPEGLLRPDAPVAVTIHRTGERPYTLRFTTAGEGGPSATPMPDSSEFPGAVPTEIHTVTPAPPTEAPTSTEMNAPAFQVIYTCGNQLCLADVSGEVKELTELPSPNLVTDFAVDPRHRWVVYAQQVGETFSQELRWVRLSSDVKPPSFTFEAPYVVRSLAWSPSGDRLALVITPLEDETRDVRAGTGLDQLWVLSLEDGQQERIIPQNSGETVDWRWLHWSQDGRYLFGNRFLPDESGPPVLYALDLSTYRLQRMGEDKKVLDQNRQGALLLGPLGEGARGQLWRLDSVTSTRPVSLTPPNRSDWGGRWSPSGDKIVFSSRDSSTGVGNSSVWLMNSDGSNRRQLTEGANDGLACWLPGGEGDYVLFMRDRFELHLLEIETGKTRQILPKANVDYVPVSLHN
jgi:hypothetical protein